jgi:penicillin-binding protein 1A
MPDTSTPTLLPTPAREPVVQPEGAHTRAHGPRTRLKKLRLALILAALSVLAVVSTVFGMLMAVASDLPSLESHAEFRAAKNSLLVADGRGGREIARLTGNNNRILLPQSQISPNIKNAVIAIEDQRFYRHEGIDYKGVARALLQDILRRDTAQGGSTITQQFVKNALSAQGNRSVFQKMREAALAYHLERQWSKQKVLTQYLNSVYFGNGAYGVESAARTYFRGDEEVVDRGRPPSASEVTPAQAALLAGMIQSPSAYDPVENPRRAKHRRDLVLSRMREQRMLSQQEYEDAVVTALPSEDEVNPPRPDSEQPYFSSWLTQQLVDRYRPGVVFGGGLKVKTTIDPELQAAAEQAISRRLTGVGPDASLVAIENKTGEVKAMVGGASFEERPFNLATNGHRQPGSAFKPFTLIAALQSGFGPDSTFTSQKKIFPVPGSKDEKFVVNNYEDQYSGAASLRSATASSDNSVYAELGLKVGTPKIARLAERMGLSTPVSTNPAMTLGGLKQGLTPLELAYAYTTIANKGVRVSGSLAPGGEGPVALQKVEGSGIEEENEKRTERVFSEDIGETTQLLLNGVIQSGTGKPAQIGEFAAGKTGTTENHGDAWFVGFNEELTVAVWVGYADKLQPMETEYGGSPVAGGTYPAGIWHDFMTSWIDMRELREEEEDRKDKDGEDDEEDGDGVPVGPVAPAAPTGAPAEAPPKDGGRRERRSDGGSRSPSRRQQSQQQQPAQPAPAPQPQPAPQPAPPTPPSGGGGAGGAAPPG